MSECASDCVGRARQEEAAAEKDPKGKARKTTGKKKK